MKNGETTALRKMELIKELTIGNYTLRHDRYLDDFGFEKDAFDLFDNEKRVHRPFHGMLKISDYKPDEPIKTTTDYTEEEYKTMLEEQVARIK